jgi:hypothetical protein
VWRHYHEITDFLPDQDLAGSFRPMQKDGAPVTTAASLEGLTRKQPRSLPPDLM